MKRLMENTVFSGFVIGLPLGHLPHENLAVLGERHHRRRQPAPLLVRNHRRVAAFHDRDDGVRRPEIDPITFAMTLPFPFSSGGGRGPGGPSPVPYWMSILISRGLTLLGLRQRHLQHAVAVGRLHLVGLHLERELDEPLELAEDTLRMQVLRLLPSSATRRSPLMLSRSPVMDTVTSFSLTPGTSTVSTSASLVSCMSTAGSHARMAGAAGHRAAEKRIEQAIHFAWISPILRNDSHRSAVPNGRQRSIAISSPP
jgi:hypothetical protein